MLVAPLAFVAVYELARLGTDGPTVDGIHISTDRFIAMAVGRGIDGVLALLPMVLGGALGAALARRTTYGRSARHGWARAGLYARRSAVALVGVGLVALAVGIARPASTDPIVAADGEPLPGSIAELTRVEIGGHDLAMMIRGHSTDSPVPLFLAGGPGGSELGAMRRHLAALEQDFVVATWDQRGTGKSYGARDPTSTPTLEQAISDTIEVTNYLRDRFGTEKIYRVGQSRAASSASSPPSSTPSSTRPSSAPGRWSAPARPTASSIATRWRGCVRLVRTISLRRTPLMTARRTDNNLSPTKEAKMTATMQDGSALANELLQRIGQSVGDKAKVSTVFGEPVEREGITVIPVAKARFGFGGGGGARARKGEGSGAGGGGGASVSPVGYIELRDGSAQFKRISSPLDVLALVAAASLAALAVRRLLA